MACAIIGAHRSLPCGVVHWWDLARLTTADALAAGFGHDAVTDVLLVHLLFVYFITLGKLLNIIVPFSTGAKPGSSSSATMP